MQGLLGVDEVHVPRSFFGCWMLVREACDSFVDRLAK